MQNLRTRGKKEKSKLKFGPDPLLEMWIRIQVAKNEILA